jgi:UDP-N-acetyl-D-glucosamine dehydrogenase
MKNELLKKLNNKDAVIGIVGLGYVGLPLMLRYIEVGYKVLGFDIDQEKVDALNNGHSYIEHISSDTISHATQLIMVHMKSLSEGWYLG